MIRRCWYWLMSLALLTWLASALPAAEPTAESIAFFENEVRPLLVQKCQKCHGPKKQESGLRLDSREALLKGGERGPAVAPGKAEQSILIAAVRQRGDLKMPPGGKLSDAQIAVLNRWVADGAAWPDEKSASGTRSGPITAQERRHWAFRPITDPPVPSVRDSAWPLTDLDRFILARLEAQSLKPVQSADKRTLIRRVTFDLIGLPPTPEEIHAFLDDNAPGAFERVVDRLLASKHYGERWGRHWLDVARYADTAGDGADYPVREAYKYRNWVIEAFNADKPYDEFLREQIAGDILAKQGPREQYAARVTATGFLAIGKRYGYDVNADFQHLDFADVIESVGRSLLGLSLGCARCHDHKYDPVNMDDYYALYGILQSTTWPFPGGEEHKRPAHFAPLVPVDKAARQDKLRAQELDRLDAEIRQLKAQAFSAVGLAFAAGLANTPVPPPQVTQPMTKLGAALTAATRQRASVEGKELYAVAYGVTEGVPVNARIQKRGEPDKAGSEVPRRFLEILGGDSLPSGAVGSGRLELAKWITRPSNPLTARVFVNRVWQWHFGRGLVATPSDFGTRGEPPSHPELLDWLAARFVASGGSVKALHRLIVRSRAYQLAGDDDVANLRADSANRLHWRFERRPLDAESIRDAMLATSGHLDRAIPAGHPFPPVNTWGFTIHNPFHAVYDSNHRSVYLMVQRNRRHPFLALFDAADPNLSVAERLPTTTPMQALFLMNAPFVHEQADSFARRLLAAPGDDAARVRLAFEATQGRASDAGEVRDALTFLAAYKQKLSASGTPAEQQTAGAWAALGRVLLTSNGFLYID
jgi:cytochrome c553